MFIIYDGWKFLKISLFWIGSAQTNELFCYWKSGTFFKTCNNHFWTYYFYIGDQNLSLFTNYQFYWHITNCFVIKVGFLAKRHIFAIICSINHFLWFRSNWRSTWSPARKWRSKSSIRPLSTRAVFRRYSLNFASVLMEKNIKEEKSMRCLKID